MFFHIFQGAIFVYGISGINHRKIMKDPKSNLEKKVKNQQVFSADFVKEIKHLLKVCKS